MIHVSSKGPPSSLARRAACNSPRAPSYARGNGRAPARSADLGVRGCPRAVSPGLSTPAQPCREFVSHHDCASAGPCCACGWSRVAARVLRVPGRVVPLPPSSQGLATAPEFGGNDGGVGHYVVVFLRGLARRDCVGRGRRAPRPPSTSPVGCEPASAATAVSSQRPPGCGGQTWFRKTTPSAEGLRVLMSEPSGRLRQGVAHCAIGRFLRTKTSA